MHSYTIINILSTRSNLCCLDVFEQWRGDGPQIDDVTLILVRFDYLQTHLVVTPATVTGVVASMPSNEVPQYSVSLPVVKSVLLES